MPRRPIAERFPSASSTYGASTAWGRVPRGLRRSRGGRRSFNSFGKTERNDAENRISEEKSEPKCNDRPSGARVAETRDCACDREQGAGSRRQAEDGISVDDGLRTAMLGRIYGGAPDGVRGRANDDHSGTQGARNASRIEDRNLPGQGSC